MITARLPDARAEVYLSSCRTPSAAGNLLFDWLDWVLVAAGFVTLVLLAMAPSEVAGIDLTTMPGRQAA